MMLVLLLFALVTSEPSTGRQDKTFIQYRYMAFAHYADSKWLEAAQHFTLAVDDYWSRRYQLTTCITTCTADLSTLSDLDTMVMLGQYIKGQECVDNCMLNSVGPPIIVAKDIEEIFRKNQYYALIQDTWARAGNISGSLEAAQTFLVHNPTNRGMYKRIEDLLPQLGSEEFITSRKDPLYHTLFIKAVKYYDEEQWGPCLHDIQQAIGNYLQTVDTCRLHCVYEYDRANSTGQIGSYIQTLQHMVLVAAECRQNCYDDLEKRSLSDAPYLASMLEYSQFCQYQMGDVQGAADSTRSYQLLHTRNTVMNANLAVYKKLNGKEGIPRPDITRFLKNYNNDMQLKGAKDKTDGEDKRLLFKTDEYYASKRMIDNKMCRSLVNLAKELAVANDGYKYDGHSSPFSKYETFSGVELPEAVKKLEEGEVDVHDVQVLIDVVTALKHDLEDRMGLVRALYFNYVHLVKRAAIPASDKSDILSHPLHGDNCIIKGDGSCVKEAPAYTHRDWSGLVYLNTPKKGGEFIITNKDKSVKESVTPACGTIAGFNGGTVHGVKQLVEGERYAIAVWFTHDIAEAIDMESLQRRVDTVVDKESENET